MVCVFCKAYMMSAYLHTRLYAHTGTHIRICTRTCPYKDEFIHTQPTHNIRSKHVLLPVPSHLLIIKHMHTHKDTHKHTHTHTYTHTHTENKKNANRLFSQRIRRPQPTSRTPQRRTRTRPLGRSIIFPSGLFCSRLVNQLDV